jgi:hypothetical protein
MNVQTTNALVSGALVFWDAGPTEHELLLAKLALIGLEKFCPAPRSANESLKGAMADYGAAEKKTMQTTGKVDLVVEPLESKSDGFVLTKRVRGTTRNEHDDLFSCKVESQQDGSVETPQLTSGYADMRLIERSYGVYRQQINGSNVGRSLVDLLSHLHGTCIRSIGGVYYLPEDAVAKWDEVVQAYESAGHKNEINRHRIVLDDQAIRTVKRAITRELVGSAGAIAEEIRSGSLGEKALEKRVADAQELRERCRLYEGILHAELAECHAVIGLAETAASSGQAVKESNDVFDSMFA